MKKYFVLFLILSLVLAVGCQKQEKSPTTTGKAFVGGGKGIDIQFINGAPPDEVYDKNYPFDITLKLKNIGEFTVEDKTKVSVSITGIDPSDFSKQTADLTKNIPDQPFKATNVDPQGNIAEGTITTVEFQGLQFRGNVTGTQEFPIRANVCYDYGTTAISKLCVLKDMLGKNFRK